MPDEFLAQLPDLGPLGPERERVRSTDSIERRYRDAIKRLAEESKGRFKESDVLNQLVGYALAAMGAPEVVGPHANNRRK